MEHISCIIMQSRGFEVAHNTPMGCGSHLSPHSVNLQKINRNSKVRTFGEHVWVSVQIVRRILIGTIFDIVYCIWECRTVD
jgi:hypothetical protein